MYQYVTCCSDCPFLQRVDFLYCNNPTLNHLEYQGAFINRDKLHEVPERCPLRYGAVTKVIKLGPVAQPADAADSKSAQ